MEGQGKQPSPHCEAICLAQVIIRPFRQTYTQFDTVRREVDSLTHCGPVFRVSAGLRAFDVCRLQAFGSLRDLKTHFGALFERTIAVALDRREVHEDVLAALSLDKAIAFGGVEPLYCSLFFHSECT